MLQICDTAIDDPCENVARIYNVIYTTFPNIVISTISYSGGIAIYIMLTPGLLSWRANRFKKRPGDDCKKV